MHARGCEPSQPARRFRPEGWHPAAPGTWNCWPYRCDARRQTANRAHRRARALGTPPAARSRTTYQKV